MRGFGIRNFAGNNRWFRSYFVIVFAIILVLLFYSVIVVMQVRQDADRNNLHDTAYYNTLTETSLESIEDYSSSLLYSDVARRMGNFDADALNSAEALSIAYDIVTDIRNFILTGNMLKDMYVYYPESDLVIGRKGAYASYVYFKSERPSILKMEDEYHLWKSCFDSKPSGFYTYIDDSGNYAVYYFLKLISSTAESQRVIVSKIDTEQMGEVFDRIVSSSFYDYAALIDSQGNVYAQAGNAENHMDASGRFCRWNSSGKFIVCQAQSEQWSLIYVTVQDFYVAYQSVYRLTIILLLSILFAALLGILLAVFFSRNNQAAVAELAGKFSGKTSAPQSVDLDYIGTEIDKLIASNASAIEAAEQQQRLVHSFFLKELLNDPLCTKQDADRLCSAYQISLENALFSLIVLTPDKAYTKDDHERLQLAAAAHSTASFSVYWATLEKHEVLLCNFEATTRLPQAPVIALVKELRTIAPCQIEVSPLAEDIMPMITFWCELYGNPTNKTEPAAQTQLRRIDSSLLAEFSSAIDRDDLTTAISLIPSMEKHFFASDNQKLVLCRRYALLAKLYESYENTQMAQELDGLFSHSGASDWTNRLTALLQKLDLDINRRIDTQQVAELVQEIIVREYNNPQLSLQMLADQVGVSQSYLSRLFKEKYGVSVIHYLNQYRVERAKELMRLSNDNLNLIAIRCGFTSNINLIRVFKKFENVTPGSFRNQE